MELRQTETYSDWYRNLRDRAVKTRIDARIERLLLGNPGDVRPVGRGVSELRIDYGPGYRIYYWQHGDMIIFLLAGGDKDSQSRDIQRAIELSQDMRNSLGA